MIQQALDDRPAQGRLAVDLSRVSFMDGSGLAVPVAAWRRALAGEGELRIVMPDGPRQV